jgi:saccharopine dehydrogenase-like NADP-dependent oxidoreductase
MTPFVMQQILILGAGKSATILIQTLLHEAEQRDLYIHVADVSEELIHAKTGRHPRSISHVINPGDPGSLEKIITQSNANLVISMLPPTLHPQVALICVKMKKHFLNASYLIPEIQALDTEAKAAGLTFICELGLDPGIDHMSAMEMIDEIRSKGGRVTRFHSHCGGLISPESDTNPWHYKISWNPRNIVMAGSDGAAYLENGQEHFVPYNQLFNPGQCVNVPEHGSWSWYANRDSISYISKYGLIGVKDFVRTTLRHPDFCHGWKHIVDLKLTNDSDKSHITGMTTRSFFELHSNAFAEKSWADPLTRNLFSYLGFFEDEPLPEGEYSSADLLQWILERKFALAPTDKDMIIMLHEIEYELNGKIQKRSAYMVVKGKDQQNTAMAITVGLPLAIAAMYILEGKISKPGVSIPLYPEIYSVIIPELEKRGIGFKYND